jgi:PAS domain S-box-containing protein
MAFRVYGLRAHGCDRIILASRKQKMSQLSSYLNERLSRRGDRASFARWLKISEATVTRWALGQAEPGFENCVQIADYFEIDPREVFRMSERADFEALFNRSFPEFRKTHVSEEDLYKNESHSALHRRVQKLLERGRVEKLASHVRLLEEEQALVESEQLLKWVFDQGPVGMTMTAPDYRFVKVNQMFCQMLGYSAEELTSMKFTDLTYAEDLLSSVAAAEKLLNGEISFHKMEKRYMKKNGSPLWVSLTGCAIVDEDGRPLYALGMSEDISERKVAEDRLRDSEEKYRLLFEKAKYPSFITAKDGTVAQINEAARDFLGVSSTDLIGADSSQILRHPACVTILENPVPPTTRRAKKGLDGTDENRREKTRRVNPGK